MTIPAYSTMQWAYLVSGSSIGPFVVDPFGCMVSVVFTKYPSYPPSNKNGELSKIGHHFSNKVFKKLMLSKNVNNKKCAPKLVFFNEKKIEKDSDDF